MRAPAFWFADRPDWRARTLWPFGALYGAVTATGGAILGALIARAFDGTPLPFAIGLAASGAATLAAVYWTERGKLFGVGPTIVQKH